MTAQQRPAPPHQESPITADVPSPPRPAGDVLKAPGSPCRACPWVEGRAAADIPAYSHEQAECLSSTSPDEHGVGPDFGAPLFACHESVEGREFPCAGWLATQGAAHPGVRLAIFSGRLDPGTLTPKEHWPPLHPTFQSMIANLRSTRD